MTTATIDTADRVQVIRQFLPNCSLWSESVSKFKADLSSLDERSTTLISTLEKSYNLCSFETNITDKDTIVKTVNQLDVLKEYVWEQLNIGHWKNIPLVWRTLYSYISLFKVFLLCCQEDVPIQEAIKECDMGLLLGQPVLDNVLSKVAFKLHLLKPSSSGKCDQVKNLEHESSLTSLPGIAKEPLCIIKNQYSNRFYIPEESMPSIESFVQNHFKDKLPVILTNVMNHWPAMKKWNVEYFRTTTGSRTVPIEIGSKYTSEEWTQKLVTMEQFIDNCILNNTR